MQDNTERDDVLIHERIRRVYDVLRESSTLENRDRLIVAAVPLIKELAKRFVKRYPQQRQHRADLESVAALALTQAAENWRAVGKFPANHIEKFVCKLAWRAMLNATVESDFIQVPRRTFKRCLDDGSVAISVKYLSDSDLAFAPKEQSHDSAVIDSICALDLFPPDSPARMIVCGILDGLTNKQIATRCGVSPVEVGRRKKEIAAVLAKHFGRGALVERKQPRRNRSPLLTETPLAIGA